MSEDNIYSTPKADLYVTQTDEPTCLFFPTSQTKLISIYLATFGIYTIYWFYKNWKLQQASMEKKIYPALRSVFYIFFTHSLFKRIDESSNEKGISKSWSAGLLATVFVTLSIVSNILGRVSNKSETVGVLDFASIGFLFILVWPLYMVQDTVNKINDDPQGNLNSSFSIYNFIFIVAGLLLWLLLGAALFELEFDFINQLFN